MHRTIFRPRSIRPRSAVLLLSSAVLCTAAAHAQSSVTLYGVADLSVERVKGDASVSRVSSGNLSGSRLGVRGTEELGNGAAAIFALETGVRFDTGTNNGGTERLWDRQAWVGVKHTQAGELRLGRTDSLLGAMTDRVGTQEYDDLTLSGSRGANLYRRVDNSATYTAPTLLRGLTLQAQYSFAATGASGTGALSSSVRGDEAPGVNAGKLWNASALYAAGPFIGGVAYLRSRDENRTTAGEQSAHAWMGYGTLEVIQGLKLTAYGDDERTEGVTQHLRTWGGKLAVNVTEPLVLALGVSRTSGTTAAAGDDDSVRIYSVKSTYALSKRTTAYGWWVLVDNGSAANKGLVATSTGRRSNGVALGIRHTF